MVWFRRNLSDDNVNCAKSPEFHGQEDHNNSSVSIYYHQPTKTCSVPNWTIAIMISWWLCGRLMALSIEGMGRWLIVWVDNKHGYIGWN